MSHGAARELHMLRRLREVFALLARGDDATVLLPLILDQAIALVGAERGFVIAVGQGTPLRFEIAAARNLDHEMIQNPEFKVSRTIVDRVARSGRSELVGDAQADEGTRKL